MGDQDWQPIETAPRAEGSPLILWNGVVVVAVGPIAGTIGYTLSPLSGSPSPPHRKL